MSNEEEVWAICEIMGHQRIAGKVSEVMRYGVPMLQVEVPQLEGYPAFTRRYVGGAIFSETQVPKDVALAFVKREAPFLNNPLALPPIRTSPPEDAEEVGPDGDAERELCGECGQLQVFCECTEAAAEDDDGEPG